jgi:hypothetical protein
VGLLARGSTSSIALDQLALHAHQKNSSVNFGGLQNVCAVRFAEGSASKSRRLDTEDENPILGAVASKRDERCRRVGGSTSHFILAHLHKKTHAKLSISDKIVQSRSSRHGTSLQNVPIKGEEEGSKQKQNHQGASARVCADAR